MPVDLHAVNTFTGGATMNSKNSRVIIRLLIVGVCLFPFSTLFAQTIPVGKLTAAPSLDGSDSDWTGIEATSIPVHASGPKVTVKVSSVSVKAGVFGDEVFLFIQWDDATRDEQHKPFIWDAGLNKYVAGEQREDRFALQFAMEGEYTTNWLSGKTSTADMWHWKAARSNPLGLMHDKMTIIGTEPVKKAYKVAAENGTTIYIQRPGDKGDKLYTTRRYSTRQKDIMPKYILTENPQGSVADVHCKGVWKDGRWNLEIRRKLDTGNPDDIVFSPGKTVMGGIAVFDHSGDDDHVISQTLTFQF
jgi:hypothetical protein